MKTLKPMAVVLLCVAATTVVAQEPAWNASAIKECDRACLVGVLDGYLNALFRKDPKALPPVRGGLIHHVEAAPFVTLPYGLGNGWTPGSGR